MPNPYLSVVIPVLDEEDNLPILVDELRSALEPCGWSYEVLFVDDKSRDRSLDVLLALASEDRTLRVLSHRRQSGQSAALVAGFGRARGEVVVTLDADLQNDPADIPRLVAELSDCDLVSGVRQRRQDSWLRRLSSKLANRVRRLVLQDSISDVGCALKAYRREFLLHLPTFNGMHRFLPALVATAGARVKEVPVHHRPRRYGRTKYNVRNRLWRGIWDLLGVVWLRRRWIDPGQVRELASSPSARKTTPPG